MTQDTATAAALRHCMAMEDLGFAAKLLTQHADTFAALIDAERKMHGHLHITDPSLYRRAINDPGLNQQVRLARAALAFVLAVQEVKDEIADHMPGRDG